MKNEFIQKLKQLPIAIRSFFWSNEPMIASEIACALYSLPEEIVEFVTVPLGPIFVGDMALQDYPRFITENSGVDSGIAYGISYEVNKRVFGRFPDYFKDSVSLAQEWGAKKRAPFISEEEARRKVLELEPWLLEKDEDESVEENPKAAMVHLPLLQAMGKYEQLGNQIITQERIRIKSQTEPVRPSLVHWLRYYRDELGVGYHDNIARGNFLFRSENGKRLSPEERERLNLILKSVEENFPLPIDTERQEIVFPKFDVPQGAKPRMAMQTSPQSFSAPTPQSRGLDSSPLKGEQERVVLEPQPRTGTWTPVVPPAVARVVRQNDRPMPVKEELGTADFYEGKLKEEKREPMNPYRDGGLGISQVPADDLRSDSGRVSFSVNHVFPAEKEKMEEKMPKQVQSAKVDEIPRQARNDSNVSKPAAPQQKLNPFSIRPVSRDDEA